VPQYRLATQRSDGIVTVTIRMTLKSRSSHEAYRCHTRRSAQYLPIVNVGGPNVSVGIGCSNVKLILSSLAVAEAAEPTARRR
jgi:hypothetical protein